LKLARELSLGSGLSLSARFDGEFGEETRTDAGMGRVRFAW